MWSDRYYYLNIYKDKSLSADTSTESVKKFINSLQEFEQEDELGFRNKEPFPFTSIVLLNAKRLHSWSSNDSDLETTNLIAIVCAKGESIDFKEVSAAFIKIASFLNWMLVDEETDEGIEDYVIWKPELNT